MENNDWDFRIACTEGDLPKAQFLYKKYNIRPDVYQHSPLKYAAQNGHIKVVEWLLSIYIGPVPFDVIEFGILGSALQNHKEMFDFLLKQFPRFKTNEHKKDFDFLLDPYYTRLERIPNEDKPEERAAYVSPSKMHSNFIRVMSGSK